MRRDGLRQTGQLKRLAVGLRHRRDPDHVRSLLVQPRRERGRIVAQKRQVDVNDVMSGGLEVAAHEPVAQRRMQQQRVGIVRVMRVDEKDLHPILVIPTQARAG